MALLDPGVWTGKVFDGRWATATGGVYDVTEPATGATLGVLGRADATDVQHAAEAAASAQRDWATRSYEERASVLRRAGRLLETHTADIQDWIVREAGSLPAKGDVEAHFAASLCHEAAALASHPQGLVLPSTQPRWSLSRRRPAGVVGVISPFNFPLILAMRSVAPALALGNAVLLKPDARTAVSGGVIIARIFQEAGLPEGLLHLLPGGRDTGEAVVTAPEVRVVSFTGSTTTGRAIGEHCGRLLKRAHLELGGNNALIVLPGADVTDAVSAGAWSSYLHQGQICVTAGRHLVHASLHEEYVAALADKADKLPVGNPATSPVALGPLIDHTQLTRVHDLVNRTVAAGARLAAGGTHEDLFYRPTVLAEVTPGMPAYAQEVFGPVAPVVPFTTTEEAIALASASEYGLSLGILGDVGQAMRIADAVPTGMVHINDQTVSDEPIVPFGGVAASGNGARFGGAEANIEAFTETQWVTVRDKIPTYPF
ncbi:benzaldehyde dehydrogenase (NAD+) [Actinomadura pelletieri DSM 43383]|uniref:Benzaldehyde dehydrogenase (NAD+) n=1 Tax=Actinomadura pelletieri DSM 43383 TaxID=1120940 RepID=A0A495QLT2_9ACTN|nr:benzaldehyde dehydrogenase [Actinomadura pelletieri]RKS73483.1 benzaldehyde dehydrogenase (NAD+) [Actinomadura pelletieri DSM 43383]